MQIKMQEKSLIKKKILKYLEYKGISKYEFYKVTGITRGILDQNNGMNEENTAKFLAVYGNEASANWLFKPIENELNYKLDDVPLLLQENSPPDFELRPGNNQSLIIKEKDERILSMKETIETQRKYISRLEADLEKSQQEKPAEGGQKRKTA